MESPEGAGIARNRRIAWIRSVPSDAVAEANQPLPWETAAFPDSPLGPPLLKWVIDESELVGFWIAWHGAGGFEGLEAAGWHRATIFRKIRTFRSYFGEHPDTHRFPWLDLDLERFWTADLEDRLALHRDRRAATTDS